MAFLIKDRVKETSTTTGTGTLTLAGAVTGFQAFSAIGNGNSTFYVIAHQSAAEWEVGIGTYTASGTTLSRDSVLSSSNAGSAVDLSAGTKDVFCSHPSSQSVYLDDDDVVQINTDQMALDVTTFRAWNSGFRVCQWGDHLAQVTDNEDTIGFAQGMYHDGSDWRYTATGVAVAVADLNAGHIVAHTQVSGTAGNIVSTLNNFYLDPHGNVGIQSYPSQSLHVSYVHCEFGELGTILAERAASASCSINILHNAELTDAWRYQYTDEATRYLQRDGEHVFYACASGTAGNAITWVTLLKLMVAGGMELYERTDPSAGAANSARLYARDNGSGKTQLCVIFATGAVQVLATEP
jgi:hypothetical protein